MKENRKRFVLLFCLDAIILLIVTAGTTLIFRRTIGFEVDLSHDLIFFLGVFLVGKILISALMDLTGFGKNFFVAAVVIGVADTIIILINSFMHFGISTRLLFFILIFDVILVAVAHIIVGIMNRRAKKTRQKNEWLAEDNQANIRDDKAMTDIYETIADGENANPKLKPAAAVQPPQRPYSWEPEETPEEDDNVAFSGLEGIDFHSQNVSKQDNRDAESPVSEDNQTVESDLTSESSEPEDNHEESLPSNAIISEEHIKASEEMIDSEDAPIIDHADTSDDASDEQSNQENTEPETDIALSSEPENSEISEDTSKQDHVVLPFDQTETLPHIEAPELTEASQQQTEPEPPKTVKASYSRDTKEHLVIGPEEIVLENSNAEIIINEDDLALIRQYMKLQQSSKQ